MEMTSNFSLLEAAAEELIGPKNCSYSLHEIWSETLKFPSLKCSPFEVKSSQNNNQSFNAYHIHSKSEERKPCIIYLHGLSSYLMEGLYLLTHIQTTFSLCLYDSRGHGKNTNPKVTYGLKQSGDLYDLIIALNKKGIEQIYLWGRSMGASTILNFLSNYGSLEQIKKLIKFVILDSPFCSFEQIAKETVANNMNIPAFLCSPLINVAINKIYEKQKIDLRSLQFGSLHFVKYPAVFIYSIKDQIVLCNHTQKIMKGYGGKFFELQGQFSHNQPRPIQFTKRALEFMIDCGRKHRASINANKSGQKKGLSISLISAKTLKQAEKQNKSPIKPQTSPKSKKILIQLSPKHSYKTQREQRPSIKEQTSFSYALKQQVAEQDRKKLKTEHKIQIQYTRSKHKLKTKQFTLTNRKYI